MKEEIGKIIDKNIDNNFTFEKNAFKNNQYCLADEIWNILDKYDNQPDYKTMWEELKDTTIFTESYPREHKMSEYYKDAFEELEQKYNIGDKNE